MKTIIIAIAAAAAFASAAQAQDKGATRAAPPPAASQNAALVEGEIRKVDRDAKKLTIRHGRLEKFDMPAMTMVFQVKDPAMLEQVKVGDKVRFDAEKVGGAFLVTHLEPAR